MSDINYYICQRFFTKDNPSYTNYGKLKIDEVVSVDCLLFPYDERRDFNKKSILLDNEQLLAVVAIEKGEELQPLDGFEFCGYDLADLGKISALSNCLGYVDVILEYVKLNKYGLVDKIEDAERLQKLLPERFLEEEHAYCEIYGVWRKLNSH